MADQPPVDPPRFPSRWPIPRQPVNPLIPPEDDGLLDAELFPQHTRIMPQEAYEQDDQSPPDTTHWPA